MTKRDISDIGDAEAAARLNRLLENLRVMVDINKALTRDLQKERLNRARLERESRRLLLSQYLLWFVLCLIWFLRL